MIKRSLKSIAEEVRGYFERGVKLLGKYDPDLCGLCGIASIFLYQRLKNEGYEPQMATSTSHIYIICDGKIVDITATQFGLDPVVIIDHQTILLALNEKRSLNDFWKTVAIFRDPDAAGFPKSFFEEAERLAIAGGYDGSSKRRTTKARV